MKPITQAAFDEEVTLRGRVEGDGIEGRPVQFQIRAASGATLATLDGLVSGGEARVKWRVNVPPEELPADLTAVAMLDDLEAASTTLRIIAGATDNTAGFVNDAEALSAAAPHALREKQSIAPGVASDGSTEGGDALPTVTPGAQADALWSRLFFDGDVLRIQLNVKVLGRPARFAYDITAELQQEVGGAFKTVKVFKQQRSPPSGGETEVVLKWTVTSALADHTVPAPYRMRFQIHVDQLVVTLRTTKQTPTIDVVPATVTVQLSDPGDLTELAREGTRQFRDDEVSLDYTDPAGAPRVAGTAADGKITLLATGRAATLSVARRSPHAEPIRWQLEVDGAAAVVTIAVATAPGNSVQPRNLTLHGRVRSSIWCDPAEFFGSGTVRQDVIEAAPKDVVLDDITLLNLIDISGKDGNLLAERKGKFDDGWVNNVVGLCHSKGIQVVVNLDAIDGKTIVNFNSLRDLFEKRGEAQIKTLVEQLVGITVKGGFDGFDIDFEDGLTRDWPQQAKDNIRIFYRLLGRVLAVENKFVGIVGGTQIGRRRDGRLMAQLGTPALGTNGLQPFDLVFEAPNLVYRPMGYDNGIKTNRELFAYHEKVIDYALRQRPDAATGSDNATLPNDGAGLHPSQFQLGVKIFVPKPPQTHKDGIIHNAGVELPRACRESYRQRRIGVIQFSWGKVDSVDLFWQRMTAVDAALNASRFKLSGGSVGQPLHVPMNQSQRDALFQPFTVNNSKQKVALRMPVTSDTDALVVADTSGEVARLAASVAATDGDLRVFEIADLDDDTDYHIELRGKDDHVILGWRLQPGPWRDAMASGDAAALAASFRRVV